MAETSCMSSFFLAHTNDEIERASNNEMFSRYPRDKIFHQQNIGGRNYCLESVFTSTFFKAIA